jgi:cytochrome oxidase Cu insertion factor (SCO1/SenC/PrrC family)
LKGDLAEGGGQNAGMRIRSICLLLVLAAGLAACGDESVSPGTGRSRPPRAPAAGGLDFTVTTFDGAIFRLARHRGTPVVLNFWESW